jgi:hypothetical protein
MRQKDRKTDKQTDRPDQTRQTKYREMNELEWLVGKNGLNEKKIFRWVISYAVKRLLGILKSRNPEIQKSRNPEIQPSPDCCLLQPSSACSNQVLPAPTKFCLLQPSSACSNQVLPAPCPGIKSKTSRT